MAQIQLRPHQTRDLEVIRDLDPALLNGVAEQLSQLSPAPLRPTELLDEIRTALSDNRVAAESVMRQCLSMNGMMRQVDISTEDVVDAVHDAIERDLDWSDDEVSKWRSIEPQFRRVLGLDAFRTVAKSIELSYEYANLYRKGRILTDIRPLFNKNADLIEGAVVSFTLRLRYENVDNSHELSIAMDESDVLELSRQCNRALTKARTASDVMRDRASIPTIITGDRGDG